MSNPRKLIALVEPQLVTVAVTAARPAIAGDGVDITSWRTNTEYAPSIAALFLDGSAAQTLSSPTGGASGPELWGYRLGQWWLIGNLNSGASISIVGVDQGVSQQLNTVGFFDRLHVAATMSAGTCQAKFVPVNVWD